MFDIQWWNVTTVRKSSSIGSVIKYNFEAPVLPFGTTFMLLYISTPLNVEIMKILYFLLHTYWTTVVALTLQRPIF